jgi:hypothetical protein
MNDEEQKALNRKRNEEALERLMKVGWLTAFAHTGGSTGVANPTDRGRVALKELSNLFDELGPIDNPTELYHIYHMVRMFGEQKGAH